jgi:hypothetical protein
MIDRSQCSVVRWSSRLDPSSSVQASYETFEADHCVDVYSRPNGTFGFEEFRRDPEDRGVWTPISYFSTREYLSQQDAIVAARRLVTWLDSVLDR